MAFEPSIGRGIYDRRYDCLFLAEVVDTADPIGLGRVKLRVPGLLDPSSLWALPIGRMYGIKNGIHWVPEVGSNGVLWLNQGDVDHPYFLPGPWGAPVATGSDIPEQAPLGDPKKVVARWHNFYLLVDSTSGSEKIVIQDLVSQTQFEVDRATGNFTRTVTGSVGSETATIKGDLTTTVQSGNETHTVTSGHRTTTIGLAETRNVGAQESVTIGGTKTENIAGAETKTVGAASTETVTLSKTITAGLAILLNAGLGVAITAGGTFSAIAAGITLNSSGPSTTISTGLQTRSFLGGILETVVGAVVVGITGVVTTTVSGLWTQIANGGMIIQGASIQIGTGTGGYKALLMDSFRTIIYQNHVHTSPPGGGTTSTPNVPTAPDIAASKTSDLTAT